MRSPPQPTVNFQSSNMSSPVGSGEKYLGMTAPISLTAPEQADRDRSVTLKAALEPHGCFEGEEEKLMRGEETQERMKTMLIVSRNAASHSGPMLVYDSVKYRIFEDSDISREETMCFVLFSRNAASVSGPMLFKGIMRSSVKYHIFEHSDLTQHSGRISCQQRLGASVCYRRTCSTIGQNSDLKLRLENG